jgi:hypothetical protein
MLEEADALRNLKAAVRELCEDDAEYQSLDQTCSKRYAVENPGPLCKIVTWAYEMVFWQKQREMLSARRDQEGIGSDYDPQTFGL